MNISIFTPSHNASLLQDAYESIKNQDFYEWIVLLNGSAKNETIDFADDTRVRICRDDSGIDFVGYLKSKCCSLATGDVLLELDHDDLLAPHCIAEVVKAFEDPDVGFVYSNSIHMNLDWTPANRFDNSHGWQYRQVNFRGHTLDEVVSFHPTPAAVSRIYYAPNHVRAFRKSVYDLVGGYSAKMRVLDDQDLMSRMYLATKFKHIDKPLYVYRIDNKSRKNSWLEHNQEIQANVPRLYEQYIERLVIAWAQREGLRKIELGGRMNAAAGFETVDIRGNPDVVCDLNGRWPFPNNSVGVVRAMDVFEHLVDSIHTMKELQRVLAPGGYAFIQVPSTDGRGAFQDPTHVSFWNENSFLYYTNQNWAKYIDTPVRFQAMRCVTSKPDAHRVSWVHADLVKLCHEQRIPGQIFV